MGNGRRGIVELADFRASLELRRSNRGISKMFIGIYVDLNFNDGWRGFDWAKRHPTFSSEY